MLPKYVFKKCRLYQIKELVIYKTSSDNWQNIEKKNLKQDKNALSTIM